MDLEDELASSKCALKTRIDIFFWIAVILGLLAIISFVFYAYFPGKIYNWFPANPHDYANNLSVILASLSGVLFVYIAFLGQRWQMLYQQQEIRDNRNEMKLSTEELKNQARALTDQISRMDRDFIHQNFFRILEQHFKTRDRLSYPKLENLEMNPKSNKSKSTIYTGEETFIGLFRFLLKWIDDKEKGWHRKLTELQPEMFERMHGFKWIDRNTDFSFSALPELKLISPTEDVQRLDIDQIQFLFRYILHEGEFDTYIRSIFYLLTYVKDNHHLKNYLKAIESGMGNQERVFMFYFLTTQFPLHGEDDLMVWLMENDFLFSIKEKELLDPLHKSLLYPKEGHLPVAHIIP